MATKKKSFFERLTGGLTLDDDVFENENETDTKEPTVVIKGKASGNLERKEKEVMWTDDEPEDAQLTVDVYQTPTHIIVDTMAAGVRPEDLSITIMRDMIVIKGKREESRMIDEENFFLKELYWGTFSRTISLPAEVEPEEAEAVEKHGLITVKIPKIDKTKKMNLKVKSS